MIWPYYLVVILNGVEKMSWSWNFTTLGLISGSNSSLAIGWSLDIHYIGFIYCISTSYNLFTSSGSSLEIMTYIQHFIMMIIFLVLFQVQYLWFEDGFIYIVTLKHTFWFLVWFEEGFSYIITLKHTFRFILSVFSYCLHLLGL